LRRRNLAVDIVVTAQAICHCLSCINFDRSILGYLNHRKGLRVGMPLLWEEIKFPSELIPNSAEDSSKVSTNSDRYHLRFAVCPAAQVHSWKLCTSLAHFFRSKSLAVEVSPPA
jgi:hypothetical protein